MGRPRGEGDRGPMRGSRSFRQGGPGQSDKNSSDIVFFCCFFRPQLILQKSNGQFQRNLSFFKAPEGVQHFPGGGVQLFRGGSNRLFPIETHITCEFPGGGGSGPPVPLSGSALGSGPPPPLKNHINIGLPSNIDPDPLKITKLPSHHSMVGH